MEWFTSVSSLIWPLIWQSPPSTIKNRYPKLKINKMILFCCYCGKPFAMPCNACMGARYPQARQDLRYFCPVASGSCLFTPVVVLAIGGFGRESSSFTSKMVEKRSSGREAEDGMQCCCKLCSWQDLVQTCALPS